MNALILAEASGTTSGDHLNALNYYCGSFLSVKTLTDRLAQYVDTDTYIITDSHGLLHGTDIIENAPERDRDQALTDATNTLVNSIPDTDIIVILTTSDTFIKVVTKNWSHIVDAANPDSIWCLGSSKVAFNECELNALRNKGCTLHTYQRVGVAPIDNETKDALIEVIRQRSP